MGQPLTFFYDFSCPYAFIASLRVEELAERAGTNVEYRPVLLGGIYRSIGAPDQPANRMTAPRVAYGETELARLATEQGVALKRPEGHPKRTVLALRAALASGDLPRATHALFKTYFIDGQDLERGDVVAAALDGAGLDGARAVAAAESDEIKTELRRRTDEAVALGLFGVPSFLVEGPDGPQLFWGQDRMRQAIAALRPCPPVDFYFDFASPFAFLAARRIRGLCAQQNATLRYHPILLGGLFRAIGTANVPLFEMSAPKQRYVMNELLRFAAEQGIPFRFASRFPVNTVKALRLVLACGEQNRGALVDALFCAMWEQDQDITSDEVLGAIAARVGEPAATLPLISSDDLKNQLKAATQEAENLGVFGVPTFRFEDQWFWGQDQIDRLEQRMLLANDPR